MVACDRCRAVHLLRGVACLRRIVAGNRRTAALTSGAISLRRSRHSHGAEGLSDRHARAHRHLSGPFLHGPGRGVAWNWLALSAAAVPARSWRRLSRRLTFYLLAAQPPTHAGWAPMMDAASSRRRPTAA